jgi:hypothetical protein
MDPASGGCNMSSPVGSAGGSNSRQNWSGQIGEPGSSLIRRYTRWIVSSGERLCEQANDT